MGFGHFAFKSFRIFLISAAKDLTTVFIYLLSQAVMGLLRCHEADA